MGSTTAKRKAYELLSGLRCSCGGSYCEVYAFEKGRNADDVARLATCVCSSCGLLFTPHWLDGYWVGRWEEAGKPGSLSEFIEMTARAIRAAVG